MNSKIEFAFGLFSILMIMAFSQISFASSERSSACEWGTAAKSGQAAFFQHANYKGKCVIRVVGRYANAKAMGIGNDKISSIKIGSGAQVQLCTDTSHKGACVTYKNNKPSLGKMNDKTSSAIIEKASLIDDCKATANNIVIYSVNHFKGECAALQDGYYKNGNSLNIGNDSLSSIKVGKNVWALLCEHSHRGDTSYGGLKKKIESGLNTTGLKTTKTGHNGNCEIVYSPGWSTMRGSRVGDNTVSSILVSGINVNHYENKVDKNSRCYPGDNSSSIAIFSGSGFRGRCKILSNPSYHSADLFGSKFADGISSIMLGENSKVYVSVYQHAKYRGYSSRFFKSATDLTYTRVGDNSISSIRIAPCKDSNLSECKDRYKALIPDKRVPDPSEAQEPDKPKVTVKRR